MEKMDVWRGFNALRGAGYIEWSTQARHPWARYVVVAPQLAERGRRELRLWPPDGLDALIAVLEQRIRGETEPARQSKLQGLHKAVRELPREVGVELVADLIAGLARN